MSTRQLILKFVKSKGTVKTSDLVKELGISRQTIAAHLQRLVNDGKLGKQGSTRASQYFLPVSAKIKELKELKMVKVAKGLEEHLVYEEASRVLSLQKHLNKNVEAIFGYAFTEMLNNAIDHSRSQRIEISIQIKKGNIGFTIRDRGIGIFANIQKGFKLSNELEAVEHILKGKQTTFPEKHSGQGIFFTSKIADRFQIISHKTNLTIDNSKNDIFVGEQNNLIGTSVLFWIKQRSKKSMKAVFDQFSNEDYEFDRNVVKVRLSQHEGLLSRSQARRLLFGLDKFRIINLDFSGVAQIGQAFADEIFRVYQNRYPHIRINYVHANKAVEFMILRVPKENS